MARGGGANGDAQMTAEQDRLWVEQARRDPAAFAHLYDSYFPRVYGYVRHHVGCRQDAEDLCAEVFLHAVAALDRFEWRHQRSFASWLFRIAHNLLANFHRQRSQRTAMVPLEDATQHPAGDLSPDEFVLRREESAALHQHLQSLSPRRQEIVALRFFGGLRNREIAAVLDLDERTVAAHLSRGLLDLHRRYQQTTRQTTEETSCAQKSER